MNAPVTTIALAGQPNTGKSTVFNRLTGSRQHVGNWPGKTVEQKSGSFTHEDRAYRLVDLPGTYSLTANSLEEIITRDYILKQHPDLVLVVVDASQLERSLYLLSETLLLDVPVVVALNMMDVARDKNRVPDPAALAKNLGLPVIPMDAAHGKGIDELLAALQAPPEGAPPHPGLNGAEPLVDEIRQNIAGKVPEPYPEEWVAVKLLENDDNVNALAETALDEQAWRAVRDARPADGALLMAGNRYEWIGEILENVIPEAAAKVPERGRFDRLATHPVWGMPLAVINLVLLFMGAMILGGIPAMKCMGAIPALQQAVAALPGPAWLSAMLADGAVVGVGMALSMTAFLVGMFFIIALVEDVGYMARLAFVSDRFMNRLGLQGKSFLPLVMSLGCNVSGVSASRVIDSSRQRLMTIVMAPIIPCGALWATVAFIGAIFFQTNMPLVVLALLLAVILQLIITSALLRKTVLPGKTPGLVMELPPYHRPNWRTIGINVWHNTKNFLKRGATVIALISIVIWALSYLPDGGIETSYLASFGRLLEPLGAFMGMDWRLLVCLMTGFASKEAALASMAVIYGCGAASASSVTGMMVQTAGPGGGLADVLATAVSPAAALAFLFAMLFSLPCVATVGGLYDETKSFKWTVGACLYYTLTSIVAGIIAYRVGLLIF